MATADACALCHRDFGKRKPKTLYGHTVCRRCWGGYVNRRQIAWFLDLCSYRMADAIVVSIVLRELARHSTSSGSDRPLEATVSIWVLSTVFTLLFLTKDGFSGYSPMKFLFGLRCMRRDTGRPATMLDSLKRNLVLLIPLMPLIAAFQVGRGPRRSDGWAKTIVVWRRHQDSPVFLSPAAAAEVFA